jgi:cellulose synthase/poly-beta-1,6-N-acetylglucosamine synthase-like glycosyltransferase
MSALLTATPAPARSDDEPLRSIPAAELAVLIPAHNEQDAIGGTLDALAHQTARPEHIVVVADNCTDATAAIAEGRGAEVFVTHGNTARKAGALNQALAALFTRAPSYVLVLDADTRVAPDFLRVALDALDHDTRLGAVSGLFTGDEPGSMLEQFQANEYERYRAQILSTHRVAVVTGTASVFRTRALEDVASSRGSALPGTPGDVYDRGAITEDSELTLALKTRGWGLVAPEECICSTELMPTWGDLHRQRVRWYKGMLDNLRAYGVTRVTARYIGQQIMIAIGALTLSLLVIVTFVTAALGVLAIQPVWLAIGTIFVAERLVTVWPIGTRGRLVAAAVFPELVYDIALQWAFAHAAALALLRRDTTWNHVVTHSADAPEPAHAA